MIFSEQHLVSIIIPTFNASQYLRETLTSILAQDYPYWECLLIDDGSSDATVTIISEYIALSDKFYLFKRPSNIIKGPSSCRNIGLENAKGAFVLFLDADDVLAPYCLSSRLKFASENTAHDFWIFKMHTFRSFNKTHLFNMLPDVVTEDEFQFYGPKFKNFEIPFPVSAPFWKLSTLKDLQGFDCNLRVLEDPDLGWRAFQKGYMSKTAIDLPEDCYYRLRPKSTKKAKLSKIKRNSILLYFSKHINLNTSSNKLFFKRLLSLYVFSNNSVPFLKESLQIAVRSKIITFWLANQILFLWCYRKLGAHKVKGLGYTSLQNYIFRKLA